MDHNAAAFCCLRDKFPLVSDTKVEEVIFVGPQIHKLFEDLHFDEVLCGDEKKLGLFSGW